MLSQKDLEEILISSKILQAKEFKNYNEKARANGKKIEEYLIEKKIVNPQILYEAAAKFYELPYIELKNQAIRKDILLIIPEITARAHQTIAFDKNDKILKVATLDISNIELFDFLSKKTGLEISLHLTSPETIREALKQYHKGLSQDILGQENQIVEGEVTPENLKSLAQDLPIVRIVDTLLEYAILEKASDIHIEPSDQEVAIRYRIDGILRRVMTLPKSAHPGIIARVKILSNLKLDEHRLPQDGRFKIKTTDYQVAFRVSIVPAFDGEKCVMRLLPDTAQQMTLDQLGFQPQAFEIVQKNINKPHGMILVTGPTGSGKTTTLYTILQILNKPEVNISTVEDPIEYKMPGINQCQVQPKIGFTFASALRSFLRQDPNIILVGEIRDNETADIAINAAMTGHLVLSTLHTNDAVTAIPRLTDMKIPTFLISSTLNIIIAQRLVRKICKNCIESFNLSAKNYEELAKQFNIPELEKSLGTLGHMAKTQKIKDVLFYRGRGCQQCGNTGYKGRLGIYEILEINSEISQLIMDKAPSEDLFKAATKTGMITIPQDGFIKAKQGITTIEEVLRVTQE